LKSLLRNERAFLRLIKELDAIRIAVSTPIRPLFLRERCYALGTRDSSVRDTARQTTGLVNTALRVFLGNQTGVISTEITP